MTAGHKKQTDRLVNNALNLEATKAALVYEVSEMLEEWEASGELASDFAVRLLQYLREHGQQVLQAPGHGYGPGA
jgi:DNA-binding transcriptional regulator YiaG